MTAVPRLLLHRCSIDTDRIYKDKVFETLKNNELEVLSRYWFIKLCGGGGKGRGGGERERKREKGEKKVCIVLFFLASTVEDDLAMGLCWLRIHSYACIDTEQPCS